MNVLKVERVKEYNGMQFSDLVTSPAAVKHQFAVSVNNKRVIESPLSLQTHAKSYKYGRELFLSSWSFNYPTVEPRGVEASKYWRSEMILASLIDTEKVRAWRDWFLDAAGYCDAILKGII